MNESDCFEKLMTAMAEEMHISPSYDFKGIIGDRAYFELKENADTISAPHTFSINRKGVFFPQRSCEAAHFVCFSPFVLQVIASYCTLLKNIRNI